MPNKIDWSAVDPLIRQYLPLMTCVEFCTKHTPFTIPRTIGQRAKLLGIKAAPKTISLEHRAAIANSVKSRQIWRIDWAKYDDLIKSELPNMTIEQFTEVYALGVSSKQVSKRAKVLGVKPGRQHRSEEHRRKIAEGVREYNFTPEQDAFIKLHRDDMGQIEIAKELGISQMAVWRRMNELGVRRDPEILKRHMKLVSLKGMLKAVDAAAARIHNMSPSEHAAYCSELSIRMTELIRSGKIRPGRGIGQECITTKGGTFKTRSSYETRYVWQLEADPNVARFTYEPFVVEYEHEGVLKHYIPDFLVVYIDGWIELVEVKPSRLVDIGRNPAKFVAARRYCVENDFDFVVVTERNMTK